MKAELYPQVAPNTVNNFISLVNKGFYDGLIFHRVINGFMIQGGDPEGTGMGGPGYGIKGEFAQNGFANDLKHTAGVLSMARSMMPNSAGSQFFIMHKDAPHLDGAYAAFGKIIEGMDVVNKIAEVATDYSDRPMEDQRMKNVTVETLVLITTNRKPYNAIATAVSVYTLARLLFFCKASLFILSVSGKASVQTAHPLW